MVRGKLMVTGASGYVGQATCLAALAAGYEVTGTYYKHCPDMAGVHWVHLDICDAQAVDKLTWSVGPTALIHAAAAWGTPPVARATICSGSRAVAGAAKATHCRLIHLSTDLVYDGERAPYREADTPSPITFYGEAKAEAEAIISSTLLDSVIVRTSLVTSFEPPDPRTAQALHALRAATGGAASSSTTSVAPLRLFTDEYRCPIRTEDLANALVELASHSFRGILHVAGPEKLSRYELGLRAARFCGLDGSRLMSGMIAESGLVRPRDCTLDISLARAILRTDLCPVP